jgi:hypothetical protein
MLLLCSTRPPNLAANNQVLDGCAQIDLGDRCQKTRFVLYVQVGVCLNVSMGDVYTRALPACKLAQSERGHPLLRRRLSDNAGVGGSRLGMVRFWRWPWCRPARHLRRRPHGLVEYKLLCMSIGCWLLEHAASKYARFVGNFRQAYFQVVIGRPRPHHFFLGRIQTRRVDVRINLCLHPVVTYNLLQKSVKCARQTTAWAKMH